ncbi:MAG: mechanosensitive ion channel family protein [Dehalococcoidia bacterium]
MDWDWFTEEGIWVITTAIVATLLLAAMRFLVPRWITSLVHKMTPEDADWSKGARTARRVVEWVGSIIIVGVAVMIILPNTGVEMDGVTGEGKDIGAGILDWLKGSGVRVALIILVAFVIQQILRELIPGTIRHNVVKRELKRERIIEEAEQRADTLSGFLVAVAVVIVWAVAIFMTLPEFRVNVGPLLAGAGIIGIAIGFGAQGLIRDLLAGIFIILEDQYAKGDWIQIAGVDGEVEHLGLRRTVLRDFNGSTHVVPNGEIKLSTNYTKDWASVNLDMPVAYGTDLDHAFEVMNRTSKEMAEEDQWKELIIETPRALRANSFEDSGIDIKLWGKTKPMWQWVITGELRKRIKKSFEQEGIEIPWPHVKLYFGDKVDLSDSLKKAEGKEKDV